jgi:hypothetical protein
MRCGAPMSGGGASCAMGPHAPRWWRGVGRPGVPAQWRGLRVRGNDVLCTVQVLRRTFGLAEAGPARRIQSNRKRCTATCSLKLQRWQLQRSSLTKAMHSRQPRAYLKTYSIVQRAQNDAPAHHRGCRLGRVMPHRSCAPCAPASVRLSLCPSSSGQCWALGG